MSSKTKYPKLRVCRTVGELLAQLQRLPESMSLDPFDDGVLPVVFNVGKPDEQLCLESNDGTWDDEAAS